MKLLVSAIVVFLALSAATAQNATHWPKPIGMTWATEQSHVDLMNTRHRKNMNSLAGYGGGFTTDGWKCTGVSGPIGGGVIVTPSPSTPSPTPPSLPPPPPPPETPELTPPENTPPPAVEQPPIEEPSSPPEIETPPPESNPPPSPSPSEEPSSPPEIETPPAVENPPSPSPIEEPSSPPEIETPPAVENPPSPSPIEEPSSPPEKDTPPPQTPELPPPEMSTPPSPPVSVEQPPSPPARQHPAPPRWPPRDHLRRCFGGVNPAMKCYSAILMSYRTGFFRIPKLCCDIVVNMEDKCSDIIFHFFTDPCFCSALRYTCYAYYN